MIYGTGIDIVKNERIKEVADKWGNKFLERVFTEDEQRYCYSKAYPYSSLAARFAAKEAFIKALSSTTGISFRDIEVVLCKDNKPSLKLYNLAEKYFAKNRIINSHLSLSHEREYSIAMVVLEV